MKDRKYTPGWTYIVQTEEELNEMRQNGDFLIIKICYKKRKWYNFWRKQISYYEVMCMK